MPSDTPQTIVTTSWDDAHYKDLWLCDLLNKYGVKGTLYVSPRNREIPATERLPERHVRELSNQFEIGAHTMTHPRLTRVPLVEAKEEIEGSKKYLEDVLGKPVTSFCYPGGYFTSAHAKLVKEAGFSLGRTVKRFSTEKPQDPFATPTTVQTFRHFSDAAAILRETGTSFLKNYLQWDELAIALFDSTRKRGGVFHLWGHSWEIERNHDWFRLEKVLSHISRHPDVTYLSNAELI